MPSPVLARLPLPIAVGAFTRGPLTPENRGTRTDPTKSEQVTLALTPDGRSYNVLIGSQMTGTLPALITSSAGKVTRLLPRIPNESPYVVDVSWPATSNPGVSTRELIRLSDDPLMLVVVENDNSGRHRYRIVVPYLSSDTPWSDSTESQTVTAKRALDRQTYVIKLDGVKIGSLPAVLAGDDGSVRQLSPTIVSKSDGVSASLEAVADSTLCRRLVAQSTGS